MPRQRQDAGDVGMPVDVMGTAMTRQEPPFTLKPLLDPGPAGLHGCRYLHVRAGGANPLNAALGLSRWALPEGRLATSAAAGPAA